MKLWVFGAQNGGVLPIKDIRVVKPGDIIIFYNYYEGEEGEYNPDAFEIMDEEFHTQILNDEWGAPEGVVIVPCPET